MYAQIQTDDQAAALMAVRSRGRNYTFKSQFKTPTEWFDFAEPNVYLKIETFGCGNCPVDDCPEIV